MMESGFWAGMLSLALQELADKEYQLRVWIRGLGPEVSSYDEAVNKLYDDLDMTGFALRADVSEDEKLSSALRALRTLLGQEEGPTENSLDDLPWPKIRSAAAESKRELDRWRASHFPNV